jgi:hypothetical protein
VFVPAEHLQPNVMKHPSVLGPFISYKENEVMLIRPHFYGKRGIVDGTVPVGMSCCEYDPCKIGPTEAYSCPKVGLSSTTKYDQNHILHTYKFGHT